MFPFEYISPKSLPEALSILAHESDALPIAGGTDLLLRYRSKKCCAGKVVNLLLPELSGIQETEEAFRIGASVPLDAVIRFFREKAQPYIAIGQAASTVGACQTRNLATIGGNFCTGNASSDMATVLLALDASVVIASAAGSRMVPLHKFFIRNREIALTHGEIVTEIVVPKQEEYQTGCCFLKIGKRKGHVIATLNAAAMVGVDASGTIRLVRLSAGTLAPKPLRLFASEPALLGVSIQEPSLGRALENAASAMLTEISPRNSLRASREYRLAVAPVVLRRVIRQAIGLGDESP